MKLRLPLLLATLAVAFYATGFVMAQAHQHSGEHQHKMEHHQELKVGKRGVVRISKETMIGDIALEPGQYKIQHREEGGAHFVRFRAVGSRTDSGDVPCTLQPLDEKAKNTAVFTNTRTTPPQIVRVVVRGENAAHVF